MTVNDVSVVVVDDEPLIRSGLRAIIDVEPDLTVVGEAGDGAEVLSVVRRTRPDVVLMDVRMPAVDGIQATRLLLDGVDPAPRVLVVTTFENDDYVYDALRVGASGFLLKRTPPDEIIAAIRTVASSESLLFPEAIRALALAHASAQAHQPTGLERYQLTEREQEVLRLMAKGLSNAEIAAELILGVQTIKTHVANTLVQAGRPRPDPGRDPGLRVRLRAAALAGATRLHEPVRRGVGPALRGAGRSDVEFFGDAAGVGDVFDRVRLDGEAREQGAEDRPLALLQAAEDFFLCQLQPPLQVAERLATLLGRRDQARPPVRRIRLPLDQTGLLQVVQQVRHHRSVDPELRGQIELPLRLAHRGRQHLVAARAAR